MPKDKSLPRYKIIHCRTCGKVIARFDRSKFKEWHVPMEAIMAKTRKHYKAKHPVKFRESIRRGVAKRRK